jgi:hypothetical protein
MGAILKKGNTYPQKQNKAVVTRDRGGDGNMEIHKNCLFD